MSVTAVCLCCQACLFLLSDRSISASLLLLSGNSVSAVRQVCFCCQTSLCLLSDKLLLLWDKFVSAVRQVCFFFCLANLFLVSGKFVFGVRQVCFCSFVLFFFTLSTVNQLYTSIPWLMIDGVSTKGEVFKRWPNLAATRHTQYAYKLCATCCHTMLHRVHLSYSALPHICGCACKCALHFCTH